MFILYMCVVYLCAQKHTSLCVHMYRPEVYTGCLPLFPSTFFFGDGSLTLNLTDLDKTGATPVSFSFNVDSGDLNPGPQDGAPSIITEPPPQLAPCYL